MKNEWNQLCKRFQEKYVEKNERLAKKFYQSFKEQSIVNYDDVKFDVCLICLSRFFSSFLEIPRANTLVFYNIK